MEDNEVLEVSENVVLIDEMQYAALVEKVDSLNSNLITVHTSLSHLGSLLAFLCVFSAYGIICRIRKKGVGR